MNSAHEIRLVEDEELGGWSAIDVETGVASDGETRIEALENLDEAIALNTVRGEPIEDVDAYLREIGIDPDSIEEKQELPEFFRRLACRRQISRDARSSRSCVPSATAPSAGLAATSGSGTRTPRLETSVWSPFQCTIGSRLVRPGDRESLWRERLRSVVSLDRRTRMAGRSAR